MATATEIERGQAIAPRGIGFRITRDGGDTFVLRQPAAHVVDELFHYPRMPGGLSDDRDCQPLNAEIATMHRCLTALPVFNEVRHVNSVLEEVRRYCRDILVVDDGSSDGTSQLLAARGDVRVVTHEENRGYGAALLSAFAYAQRHGFEKLVTIDCDGQHEPQRIPLFFDACTGEVDLVSGSRYLEQFDGDSAPPEQRRRINQQVTAEINRRLGLSLTDAFCGFKCYRVAALQHLNITEPGYAMPLEVWVQAAAAGWRIVELPVPLIYLDEKRSFGGVLDDAQTRLEYYHLTLDRALAAVEPGCCAEATCGG